LIDSLLKSVDEILTLSLIESDVISDDFVWSDDSDDNENDEDGKDDDDDPAPTRRR
jgi:hypothetical protein